MEADESPAERSRPWHAWHEPEDCERDGAADQRPDNGSLELAGGPHRPVAAVLREEKRKEARQNPGIHPFMIRGSDRPGLPFNPLDVPFSESSLP